MGERWGERGWGRVRGAEARVASLQGQERETERRKERRVGEGTDGSDEAGNPTKDRKEAERWG